MNAGFHRLARQRVLPRGALRTRRMPMAAGTLGLFHPLVFGAMLRDVEASSIAHALPELYRAVLQRVTSLEHVGSRHEAFLIRRAATAAYSKAWDARAHQRLSALQLRADRVLGGMDQPRASLAPRPVPRWSRSA